MNASVVLREARRRAGLSQRELAAKAGTAVSVVSRIESAVVDPRVGTLDHLLRTCGEALYARPHIGEGLDRSHISHLRRMDIPSRLAVAEESAEYMAEFRKKKQSGPRSHPSVVLETLSRHGARFVVIGGVAANFHGSPSVTQDTDVCFARERENLEILAKALRELHAYPRGWPEGLLFVMDWKTLDNMMALTLDTDAGPLDLLAYPDGTTGFDGLFANADRGEIGGQPVLVASVNDLIRMKLAAGRPKDLIEVEVLGSLLDEIESERSPE